MIRKNYAFILLLSLGFFSTCCAEAEQDLSTFFGKLEAQVKELETKTNPPKKEISENQLVNTEAPEETKKTEVFEEPVTTDSLEDDELDLELELEELE